MFRCRPLQRRASQTRRVDSWFAWVLCRTDKAAVRIRWWSQDRTPQLLRVHNFGYVLLTSLSMIDEIFFFNIFIIIFIRPQCVLTLFIKWHKNKTHTHTKQKAHEDLKWQKLPNTDSIQLRYFVIRVFAKYSWFSTMCLLQSGGRTNDHLLLSCSSRIYIWSPIGNNINLYELQKQFSEVTKADLSGVTEY